MAWPGLGYEDLLIGLLYIEVSEITIRYHFPLFYVGL